MCSSGPSAPKIPKPPPPPDIIESDDPSVKSAREKFKKQAAAASGRTSTIATGPLGVTQDPTIKKTTLLGQAAG